ncbi:MAG TPA: hypothetical protein VMW40_00235 [Candidatus Bathyarchaeia archaeon]|nr:hypothetical protein [Candidatus Bathyarchaeia archaeon]
MTRELNEKDIALLKKLAPELEELICESSNLPFRSILPPLSNHFSKDVKDFERRLRNLKDEELAYLVDMIMEGLESLSCVPPEHAEAFISLVAERITKEAAEKITTLYLETVCL